MCGEILSKKNCGEMKKPAYETSRLSAFEGYSLT
jgi:hypothetical protein